LNSSSLHCSDGKKMTVLFRHNRNFCLLPLARSLGISLATIFQPAETKIKIGGSGVVWCGGVRWGGVRAINYFFEFPTQNVLPQKYAIRSSSSSLAIVNASRTCSDNLLVPKFFKKNQASLHSTIF